MTDPLVGRVLRGRYRIERRLGQGGMGAVYAAVHLELARPVAIKTLIDVVDRNGDKPASGQWRVWKGK